MDAGAELLYPERPAREMQDSIACVTGRTLCESGIQRAPERRREFRLQVDLPIGLGALLDAQPPQCLGAPEAGEIAFGAGRIGGHQIDQPPNLVRQDRSGSSELIAAGYDRHRGSDPARSQGERERGSL